LLMAVLNDSRAARSSSVTGPARRSTSSGVGFWLAAMTPRSFCSPSAAWAAASGIGPAAMFCAISRSGPLTRSVCQRKKAIRFAGSSAAPAVLSCCS